MKSRLLPALAALAFAALAACGGSALLFLVPFVAPAGGDFYLDANAATPAVDLQDCGNGVDDRFAACQVNIQGLDPNGVSWTNFYALNQNVRIGDPTPGTTIPQCAGKSGRIEGGRLVVPGCFAGAFTNVNEIVADGGATRLLFDYLPDLQPGVWVDMNDSNRRFKFDNQTLEDLDGEATGCLRMGNAAPVPVAAAFKGSRVFENKFSAVTSLTIRPANAPPEVWSAQMVGVSGLRLTRGSSTLELQRLDAAMTC